MSARHHKVAERDLLAVIEVLESIEDLGLDEQRALDRFRHLVATPTAKVPAGRGLSSRRQADPPELVAGRAAIRVRSGGYCEARTVDCTHQAVLAHHRAGRGFAGCHHPELLLDLCNACHLYVHAQPDESYVQGWMLRRHGAPLADLVRSLAGA